MPPLIKKIILCSFAILWTPIACEAYLRLFFPVDIMPRFIEEGEHGIRRNIPGERYIHSSAEYRVDFSINEQGLRDPRVFERPKQNDVFRVVLLGDSFAMGYGVSYEDSVPARLETELAVLLKRPVEVVNLGVSGFGTAEELIVLEKEGWSYEPDLVMAYWHPSDPLDDVRSQLYELSGENLIQLNDSYLPAVAVRTWLFSFSAYRWIAEHSEFYNWIRGDLGKFIRELLFIFNSLHAGDPVGPTDDPDVVPKHIRLNLALLDRIQKSCEQRDVDFFITDVPVNFRPGSYNSAFPYDEMKELGYAFEVVDPIPLFETSYAMNDGSLIYWQRSAGHWTPLGTAAVTAAIVDHIKTQK